MNKCEMLSEIKNLKRILLELNSRIDTLEKEVTINDNKENEIFSNIESNEKLLNGFINYLVNIKQLKDSTAKDYISELKKIRIKFKELMSIIIPYELYHIEDLHIINKLYELFKNNGDFIALNHKWHNSLSAAFNNYVSFLEHNRTAFVLDED